MSESMTETVEIFRQLLETVVSTLSDDNWSSDILDVLNGLREVYESCSADKDKQQLVDLLVTDPLILPTVYGFINKIFCDLGVGVERTLGHCMLLLLNYLLSWSGVSRKLCIHLVNEGHLMQHFMEIKELSNSLANDKFAQNLILINIGIIYNCKEENLEHYFEGTKCLSALEPFLCCSQWELQFHCRVILSSVIQSKGNIDIGLAKLSKHELKTLFSLLDTIAHSSERSASIENCKFLATELLTCVNFLLINADNLVAFATNTDFISLLPGFLTSSDGEEQTVLLKILWKLLLGPLDSKEVLGDHHSVISDAVLKLFKTDDSCDMTILTKCISFVIASSTSADIASQLDYAIGCYKFGHYRKCYEMCDCILTNSNNAEMTNKALVLKGKSAYHLYNLEKAIPKNLRPKEFHQRHASCYAKAREVIKALGKALDFNCIDVEGSKMLDIAMMDYAMATNNLKDLKRCLLCRKIVKALIRSHICPNSILGAFTAGAVRPEKSHRVIDTKLDAIGEEAKSPKEITYFLYCHDCEETFSKYGETQFLPEFFRVIYDVKTPSKSDSIRVHYKEWLHQFCVGIIFRSLSLMSNKRDVINEDEVYQVFTSCRDYLLLLNDGKQSDTELPDIYILINPTIPRPQDAGYVFMNQTLHMMCMHGIIRYDLSTGNNSFPHRGHYFIFHTGIINIVFKFSPSQKTCIAEDYLISMGGGLYEVPDNIKRNNVIPPGLWKFFQASSITFYQHWLERLSSTRVTGPMTIPDDRLRIVYGIVDAVQKDLEDFGNVINPSPEGAQTLVVNLLPKEISFLHNSSMKLPEDHKMLLHLHFDLKDGDGEIVFLAVSFKGKHSRRPYVIYHFYSPKLVMNAGFFINPNDMTAEEFLPGSDSKMIIGKLQYIANVRRQMPKVIPLLLKEKGFSSLPSLLHRVSSQERAPVTTDLKCSTLQRCWYCRSRCEICLNKAVYGQTVQDKRGMALKFCSRQCQLQHTSPGSLPLLVKVFSPKQLPDNFCSNARMIQDSHNEILFIQGTHSGPDGNHIKLDITLCSGDGSEGFPKGTKYVVYYHRSAHKQLFVEYFVSEDMAPTSLLPYYGKMTVQDILGDTFPAVIKGFISKALMAHHVQLAVENSHLTEKQPNDADVFKEKFKLVCMHMSDNSTKDLSDSLMNNICAAMAEVQELFAKAPPQLKQSMVDQVVALVEPAKQFHAFLERLFQEIVDGNATRDLVHCLLLQQHLLMAFTDGSEQFCDMILYNGFICQQIDQVLALRQSGSNPFIDQLLSMAVGIIYNCRMSNLFLVYFEEKDCSFFVKPYLNSTNWVIAFQCKAILSSFAQQLTEARSLIALNEAEIDSLLRHIGDALHSTQFISTVGSTSFSASELIVSLVTMLVNIDNKMMLGSKTELIPLWVAALTSGNAEVEKLGYLLLWSMLTMPSPRGKSGKEEKVRKGKKVVYTKEDKHLKERQSTVHAAVVKLLNDSELCDVFYGVLESKAYSEDDCSTLGKCILWALKKITFPDNEQCLMYMEECFKYDRYYECYNCYCDAVQSSPPSDLPGRIKYLAGKSCFYIYKEKKRLLQFVSLAEADMYLLRDSCFSFMYETIKLLGASSDQGVMEVADQWMLDRAMIDYIRATNNLKDCMRCLLCLKKSRDIRRSHFCPRKILERFASGCYIPNNMKGMLSLHDGNVVACDTPKTETRYMFCASCEDILSQQGETQFLPQFFDKLYDIADVINSADNSSKSDMKSEGSLDSEKCIGQSQTIDDSRSSHVDSSSHLSQARDIVYDRWLYLFCIGIIFRGIAYISRKSFVNDGELYNLFVKCRECLLKAPHIDDMEDLPVVEIFISPSKPKSGDENHGFINLAMRMVYQFTIGATNLQDGVFEYPQKAHFVLAQVGIINIIAKLPPSQHVPASSGCVISKTNGAHSFHIPASEERYSLMYLGIWEVIYSTAQELLEAWWQRPKQFLPQDAQEPPAETMDLYNIEGSGFTDMLNTGGKILSSHIDSQQPTTLNFLPDGFYFNSDLHTINLPDRHKILVHYYYVDPPVKILYSVAVGDDGKYKANKPYVVVHFSAPGVVIKFGFFVDVKELTALEFLPDRKPREMIEDVKVVQEIRNDLPNILLKILKDKGCCSLLMVLDNYSRFCIDTKCKSVTCWYCQDLCEWCLQPSTQTLNTVYEDSTYNFCSTACKDFCFTNENGLDVVLPQSTSSSDIAEVTGHLLSKCNKFSISMNTKIFTNKDNHLVILYHERSVRGQFNLQCFVTKELNVLHPVVETEELASDDGIKQKQVDMLQHLTEQLMSSMLPEVYQKIKANEELAAKLSNANCLQVTK